MFRPGNIHQQFEFVLCRQVQEPAWRHVVNAEEIGAQFADLLKIQCGMLARPKHLLLLVRREWTVGKALEVKFFFAKPKKFSVRVDARRGGAESSHRTGHFSSSASLRARRRVLSERFSSSLLTVQ